MVSTFEEYLKWFLMKTPKYFFESAKIVVLTSSPSISLKIFEQKKKNGFKFSHPGYPALQDTRVHYTVCCHIALTKKFCTITVISSITTVQKKSWKGNEDTEF